MSRDTSEPPTAGASPADLGGWTLMAPRASSGATRPAPIRTGPTQDEPTQDEPTEDGPDDVEAQGIRPRIAAVRARRRRTGWWKGAGLASALVALIAVVLLCLLLVVPLFVASTM